MGSANWSVDRSGPLPVFASKVLSAHRVRRAWTDRLCQLELENGEWGAREWRVELENVGGNIYRVILYRKGVSALVWVSLPLAGAGWARPLWTSLETICSVSPKALLLLLELVLCRKTARSPKRGHLFVPRSVWHVLCAHLVPCG